MDDNKPKNDVLAEHRENVRRNRTKRATFWKVATVVLLVLLILVIYTKGIPTGFSVTQDDAAVEKAVNFINSDLLMGLATAEVVDVSVNKGMYKIDLLVQSATGPPQEFTSYVTKDGTLLFPTAIEIEDIEVEEEEEVVIELPEIDYTNDATLGPADAEVTIIEYSDFECPFCSRGYETIKLVVEEYEGQVKLIFKNFPLSFHPNAQKAAEAAECAQDQDMFWELHDVMFENQEALTVDDLKQYAADLGLDIEQFNTCLDSNEKADEVQQDMDDGALLGVTGTPAFFINGKEIVGAQPIEVFRNAIDEALAEPEEEVIVEEEVEEEEVVIPEVDACTAYCEEEGFTAGTCRSAEEEFCQEGEELKGGFELCEEGSLNRCCCS